MMKRSLYTFLAAAAISTTAMIAPALVTPAAAQASLSLNIGVPLPAPMPFYEVVPAPRPGYIWNAGYWRYEGGHRYWERGRWAEHRYEERHGWNEHRRY
jgi:hypothetical protein